MTKAHEPKRYYVDVMMLTQGFSEPMSVLGLDLWAQMLYDIKLGMFTSDKNGSAPALYGKEYFSLSAISKVVGLNNVDKLLSGYDSNLKKILTQLDLKNNKFIGTPVGLKHVKWRIAKGTFAMAPNAIKSVVANHEKVLAEYKATTDKIMQQADELVLSDDFSKQATDQMKTMSTLLRSASVLFEELMRKIN